MDSVIHRRDARAKAIVFLGLVVAVILVPVGEWWPFAAAGGVLATLWGASGVPASYLLKRLVILSPFIALNILLFPFLYSGEAIWSVPVGSRELSVSREGLTLAGNLALKFALSVLGLGLLFSVTRFHQFLAALRRFGVPRLLLMQCGFLYRYLYVVVDEAERMLRARDARRSGRAGWQTWRGSVGIIGVLLLRSFERSERIYRAMLARGFSGEVPTLERWRFRAADAALVAIGLAASTGITLVWALV